MIETSATWLTVSVAMPLIEPEVAVIVDEPTPTPVASPPAAIVATEVIDELQLAVFVRFCVLPSLYVPVAVNCWVAPFGMDAVPGVTAIEVSTAVTVNVAVPVIFPELAVIVTVPAATPVANPVCCPTVAIAVLDEVQLADVVRFFVLPSLYVPVAVNCWVEPAPIEAVPGVTAMELNTAAVTVNVADPLIVPDVAVIVAVPCAMLVASPPLLTVATEVADEVQVALLVRF